MRCFQLTAFNAPLAAATQYVPVPTGAEVVVRVTGAGVCHSDLHLWEGFHDLGHGRRNDFSARIALPLTLGHETAGTVHAAGPEAEGVEVGDNVLVCSWVGCGACPACRAGNEHQCAAPRYRGVNHDGGYAEFVAVPHGRYLLPLGSLDPAAAAPLACSGLTAFAALRKAAPAAAGTRPLIIGAGGLGLMAVGLARLMEQDGPVVIEPDAGKRAAALAAGAAAAFPPGAAPEEVRAACGGEVRAAVDFVGSEQSTAAAFDLLARGGTLLVVGLFGGALSIPLPALVSKSVTIAGSYIGPLSELRELVALVRERGLPDVPIRRRPLHEAQAALDALRAGGVTGRTVLVPGAAPEAVPA